MQERRKFDRKYLMFYTRVFNRETGELVGHLADLTAEGAQLICEQPVATDQLFHLSMDLPIGAFSKQFLNFDAQCVWCKPDIDPNFYGAGFHLINLNDDDRAIIERIINEYDLRRRD
jgi:hypothetical protein